MIPTEVRLIDGIRKALAAFATADRSAEDRRRVAAIEVALSELLLRQDREFFAQWIEQGRALQTEARALGAAAPAEEADTVDHLCASLAAATAALVAGEKQDSAIKRLLARLVDWENSLHARRLRMPATVADSPSAATRFTAQAIENYLRNKSSPWRQARVSNVRQLSGGFSKVTVLFDVDQPDQGQQSLVIRAEQPLTLIFLEGADIHNEYHVIRLAATAGLPVAEPLWMEEDATALGARLFVTRRAPGRNFGSRIDVKDAISDGLLRDILRHLVRIHGTRIDEANDDVAASHLGRWARHASLSDCIANQMAFWREKSADFGLPPAPILVRALGWLQDNVPANPSPPVLLHGDFGLHNVLIGDDDRVSCILDWEAAGIGDPADDIIWLSEGLKASVERSRILDIYRELGGQAISEERLRYFEVMNSVRFAVTCPRALYLFQEHLGASIDACQLGFLYMYHGTNGLNRSIELAESAAAAHR